MFSFHRIFPSFADRCGIKVNMKHAQDWKHEQKIGQDVVYSRDKAVRVALASKILSRVGIMCLRTKLIGRLGAVSLTIRVITRPYRVRRICSWPLALSVIHKVNCVSSIRSPNGPFTHKRGLFSLLYEHSLKFSPVHQTAWFKKAFKKYRNVFKKLFRNKIPQKENEFPIFERQQKPLLTKINTNITTFNPYQSSQNGGCAKCTYSSWA